MRIHILVLTCVLANVARAQTVTPISANRCLAWADSAVAATSDADRGVWQRRVTAAHDTVVATVAWLGQQQRGGDGLRLLLDVDRYWANVAEQVSLYANALAVPSAQQLTQVRARALIAGARDAHRIKDQAKVRAWANEGIRIYRQLGDSAGVGRGYLRLMFAAIRDNDHRALQALADTGEPFCARRDNACDAEFNNMRGESWRALAQYDSALHYYQRANALVATPGFGYIHNLGFAYLGVGQVLPARAQFVVGLRRAWAAGDRLYSGFLLAGVASSYAADSMARAALLFGLSDAIEEQVHASPDPADAIEYDRYRSRARARLGAAVFDSLLTIGKRLAPDSVIVSLTRAP